MKPRSPFTLKVFGCLLAVALGTTALAHGFGLRSFERRADFVVNRIKDKLDLNGSQIERLEAIKNDWVAFREGGTEQAKKDRAWIRAQILGDQLDTAAVLDLLEERHTAVEERLPDLLGKVAAFHQSLSREQKARAVELIDRFVKHHEG